MLSIKYIPEGFEGEQCTRIMDADYVLPQNHDYLSLNMFSLCVCVSACGKVVVCL